MPHEQPTFGLLSFIKFAFGQTMFLSSGASFCLQSFDFSTPLKMTGNENFACFPCLQMLSRCFHFGVFEFFVSGLFLLLLFAFGEY